MIDRPNPLAAPIRGTAPVTITMFGDNDRLDHALSQELGRRGCRTHAISVDTGWLSSAANVICRLDTVAGQRALESLANRKHPHATVIAVCERPTDELSYKRLRDMCEECGRHHDVSLIWHSTVAETSTTEPPPLEQLAVTVVNEVSAMVSEEDGATFSDRYLDLA